MTSQSSSQNSSITDLFGQNLLDQSAYSTRLIAALRRTTFNAHVIERFSLVSWCFEPSQLQRITSGLNSNFSLSPSHSFHKSIHHKSFLSLSLSLSLSLFNHSSKSIHNFGTQNQKKSFGAYLYSRSTQHGNLHPAG